jgi:prevent-host-death family protein
MIASEKCGMIAKNTTKPGLTNDPTTKHPRSGRGMKTIKNSHSLRGQKEIVTVTEFRKMPGEVFNQVEMGLLVLVTKNGKPIATIQKFEPIRILGAEVRRLGLDKGGY